MRPSAPRVPRRVARTTTSFYVERALLLWPRLDRAKIRKVADDPARIAEIVVHRTSQPFEVILAMLTRQAAPLASPPDPSTGFESGRLEGGRIALRIVRSEEGDSIQVHDLWPA